MIKCLFPIFFLLLCFCISSGCAVKNDLSFDGTITAKALDNATFSDFGDMRDSKKLYSNCSTDSSSDSSDNGSAGKSGYHSGDNLNLGCTFAGVATTTDSSFNFNNNRLYGY